MRRIIFLKIAGILIAAFEQDLIDYEDSRDENQKSIFLALNSEQCINPVYLYNPLNPVQNDAIKNITTRIVYKKGFLYEWFDIHYFF